MSTLTASPVGAGHLVRAIDALYGVLLITAGVLGVVFNRQVCLWEAWLNGKLLSLLGVVDDPQAVGSGVIFAQDGRYIGFLVTPGCSVALLLAPFLGLAGILLLVRRGRFTALLSALGLLLVVFVATNQLRLASVAVSMDVLGFEQGYELSHVTIGSIVSALGLVFGVVVFAVVLTREQRNRAEGGGHRA